MCRTGGPRCDGSRRARTTTTTPAPGPGTSTATATEPTPIERSLAAAAAASGQAPKGGGNVPGRERTDELAANLPADRKGWDGQPLDDKGRRLYALRESGYTGPIDQDGYPDTTSDGASTLRRMARDRGETVDW